ncbi:MAG: hypothetical protein RR893_07490, partial [Clostridia bacterium]
SLAGAGGGAGRLSQQAKSFELRTSNLEPRTSTPRSCASSSKKPNSPIGKVPRTSEPMGE